MNDDTPPRGTATDTSDHTPHANLDESGRDVPTAQIPKAELERLLRESETARASAEAAKVLAEAARREADEANHAKSGFLATMSHELRTPINAMIGYTQLLDLGLAGPLTDQQREYLERLRTSSQHLLGLVNDVLDLSKIEAGEARVVRRDAMTGSSIQAALDLVRPQAESKGVRLVDDRPDDLGVPYIGDDDRVRQIILNFLSNAAKFTPAGGTVTVACDTVETTPPEAHRLQGEGPWACVRVQDTGVGIPIDEQERVFEPFHQVEGGHTRRAGGTGLGLAISRQLAWLMCGDITVESVPGEGSTFTLWLPAAQRALGMPAETATERSARAERVTVALQAPGLGHVGEILYDTMDAILDGYVNRVRSDPAIPHAHAMRRVEVEDHAVTLLADLAQSLVIIEDVGHAAAELLRDGSAIQRTIADAHGARRFAQGWSEAGAQRDLQLLREEIERAVRGRLHASSGRAPTQADEDRETEAAVRVLLGLIDRATAISLRAWRRAADGAEGQSVGKNNSPPASA